MGVIRGRNRLFLLAWWNGAQLRTVPFPGQICSTAGCSSIAPASAPAGSAALPRALSHVLALLPRSTTGSWRAGEDAGWQCRWGLSPEGLPAKSHGQMGCQPAGWTGTLAPRSSLLCRSPRTGAGAHQRKGS